MKITYYDKFALTPKRCSICNKLFWLEWYKENNIPLLRIPYTDYEQLDVEYLFSKIPKIGGESNFAFSI